MPAGLSNVVAIAAGGEHNLAVSNGFVVAWGNNGSGQCNVPASLSNVWDVAAGWQHSVALKKDGTVVAWGDNSYGESSVPAGLSNVVAIAAGADYETDTAYSLALKRDGTVVVWGVYVFDMALRTLARPQVSQKIVQMIQQRRLCRLTERFAASQPGQFLFALTDG